MDINISEEKIIEIVDWAAYHYGKRLEGLVFFDPSTVDHDYPRAEINLLLVLNGVSDQARDRYQSLSDGVLSVIFGDRQTIQCRIQTPEEIQSLLELQMPLLRIYLQDSFIAYDPGQLLTKIHADLTSA